MGQQPSKASEDPPEVQRLRAAQKEQLQLAGMLPDLNRLMLAEVTAGKPATPGSHQARLDAVWEHYTQLRAEIAAIQAHLNAQREGRDPPPMPAPTPPLVLAPLVEPASSAAPAPTSPPGEQLDTPIGTSSFSSGQRGSSSGNGGEEAAHAGSAEGSDAMPLLAAGSGQLAPGLRRRQGHQGCG